MARELTVPAFAKVNLGLEVLGLRQDGYHELRTIFQTIDIQDEIRLSVCRSGVSIECEHPLVPTDASNLAARAAASLLKYAQVRTGVRIRINKRIPVAGGLGGGSSDAAAVLMGLDRLLRLGLGRDGLYPLARRLGADVPFFLWGGTALGIARGEEIYPLHRQIRAHCVLIDPGRPVGTAGVFKRVDDRLTPRENSNNIIRFVLRDLEGPQAFRALTNDLETAALEEAPELAGLFKRIHSILVREGALLASLSGSGSSYFGLFDDRPSAMRAAARLRDAGFNTRRARTITIDRFQDTWSRATLKSA